MTAFVILYCVVTHIKIIMYTVPVLSTIVPCHIVITIPIPLYFLIISFKTLPYGHIDIAKAEIDIYE